MHVYPPHVMKFEAIFISDKEKKKENLARHHFDRLHTDFGNKN